MSKKKILIVANWKMNPKTVREAVSLFSQTAKIATNVRSVEVAVCPPVVYLPAVSVKKTSSISLGVQTVASHSEGAHTGEVSATQVRQFKIKYAIVGHSERRALGETDEMIRAKIKELLSVKITPIICVGEIERDHDMWYLGVVKTQLEECLMGIPKTAISSIVIAYEPVWAISSTKDRRDATPADFEEMRIYIQKIIADMFGPSVAKLVRILYGGSVNEKNAAGFLSDGLADGFLVGKASLNAKKFESIITTAHEIH